MPNVANDNDVVLYPITGLGGYTSALKTHMLVTVFGFPSISSTRFFHEQNVERIIALGAPSAAELEELYATGQLSRNEVETRRLAERKKQAEKVTFLDTLDDGLVLVKEVLLTFTLCMS